MMLDAEPMIFLILLAGVAVVLGLVASLARSRFGRAVTCCACAVCAVAAVRFWTNARASSDYAAMTNYVGFYCLTAMALGLAGGLTLSIVRAAR